MPTIVLISGGDRKIWEKQPHAGLTPARFAYTSAYFRAKKAFCERFYPERWLIVSPHYGFLTPDVAIPSGYSCTWHRKQERLSLSALHAQASQPPIQLVQAHQVLAIGNYKFVALMGDLCRAFGLKLLCPLSGISVGEQLVVMNDAVKKNLFPFAENLRG